MVKTTAIRLPSGTDVTQPKLRGSERQESRTCRTGDFAADSFLINRLTSSILVMSKA